MNSTGWVATIFGALVIIGGAWWFATQPAPASPTGNPTSIQPASDAAATTSEPKTVYVSYDGKAFSPANITVKQGDTVTFTNTAGTMWVASDQHPSHSSYDGTNRTTHCTAGYTGTPPLDQCAAGSSFSFKFDKVGTFGYHDHQTAGNGGRVIVQ